MRTPADPSQEQKSQQSAKQTAQPQRGSGEFQFVDERPEAVAQRALQEMASESSQVAQLRAVQEMANGSTTQKQLVQMERNANRSTVANSPVQRMVDGKRDHEIFQSQAFYAGLSKNDQSIFDAYVRRDGPSDEVPHNVNYTVPQVLEALNAHQALEIFRRSPTPVEDARLRGKAMSSQEASESREALEEQRTLSDVAPQQAPKELVDLPEVNEVPAMEVEEQRELRTEKEARWKKEGEAYARGPLSMTKIRAMVTATEKGLEKHRAYAVRVTALLQKEHRLDQPSADRVFPKVLEESASLFPKAAAADPDHIGVTVDFLGTEFTSRRLLINHLFDNYGIPKDGSNPAISRMVSKGKPNTKLKRSGRSQDNDIELTELRKGLHASFGMGNNGCTLFYSKSGGKITVHAVGNHVRDAKHYDIAAGTPPGPQNGRFEFP